MNSSNFGRWCVTEGSTEPFSVSPQTKLNQFACAICERGSPEVTILHFSMKGDICLNCQQEHKIPIYDGLKHYTDWYSKQPFSIKKDLPLPPSFTDWLPTLSKTELKRTFAISQTRLKFSEQPIKKKPRWWV